MAEVETADLLIAPVIRISEHGYLKAAGIGRLTFTTAEQVCWGVIATFTADSAGGDAVISVDMCNEDGVMVDPRGEPTDENCMSDVTPVIVELRPAGARPTMQPHTACTSLANTPPGQYAFRFWIEGELVDLRWFTVVEP